MENFLAKKLKRYRKQHELTQKQLASILYVSDKTVSKWERGNGQPDIETLKKIAQLLETTIDNLLNEREPVYYFEYKSTWMIGLLPILHVVIPNFLELIRTYGFKYSYFSILKKLPHAKGIISCGFLSTGIFSLGIFSRGIFSIGILSLDMLSFGVASGGVISFGSLAVGLIAFGNFALGLLAFANLGIGYLSIGNLAIGRIAIGNHGAGTYALSLGGNLHDKEILAALQQIQQLNISSMVDDLLIQPMITFMQTPWITVVFVSLVILLSLITIGGLGVGLMRIIRKRKLSFLL
ncbi:helix-turn-helix transcriptional regulator [Candidatus Enterococcus ferrettii]|uniref:HTH cro/C1-type domain-containing protein n=1 Tax=Candidatus Enterococcus ferrettii TaxID=2815324 RepID=A0ABV0EWT7_9ENTE|nr:helix-turn-helix transcriptional regulator [Enterococcus sp. 665A]MBO1342268.1 helix-turn-helix transcriptional regulator [Enterococcus sp. 665A]